MPPPSACVFRGLCSKRQLCGWEHLHLYAPPPVCVPTACTSGYTTPPVRGVCNCEQTHASETPCPHVSVCTGMWGMCGAAGGDTPEPHPCEGPQGTPHHALGRKGDPDHSQRGKLKLGKRTMESSRGQSVPVGKQDKKRARVQGEQPPTPHEALLRYWARPFPWCSLEQGCSPTAGKTSRPRPRLDPELAS